MRTHSEYIGAADEVARKPVSERDLTTRRRRVIAANASLADQVDSGLCVALIPDQLTGLHNLLASDRTQAIAIGSVEAIQQTG